MSENQDSVSDIGPPTPKYVKISTQLAHDQNKPPFGHVLDIVDPDAQNKANRFMKQPVEYALDDYFDFDDTEQPYIS